VSAPGKLVRSSRWETGPSTEFRAGFVARLVAKRFILIESFLLYKLTIRV
jgi:hypothetical protein